MESTDITIEILKEIRDGVRETHVRVDETNSRLEETNGRLESLRDELSRRIVASEVRTATAITDLHGTVRDLVDVLRAEQDLRPRVGQCEQDIATIKARLQMG